MGKTIEELKEIIVELQISLARATVPMGNCPYAYYPLKKTFDCNDCYKCKAEFWKNYRKLKEEEVKDL